MKTPRNMKKETKTERPGGLLFEPRSGGGHSGIGETARKIAKPAVKGLMKPPAEKKPTKKAPKKKG